MAKSDHTVTMPIKDYNRMEEKLNKLEEILRAVRNCIDRISYDIDDTVPISVDIKKLITLVYPHEDFTMAIILPSESGNVQCCLDKIKRINKIEPPQTLNTESQ